MKTHSNFCVVFFVWLVGFVLLFQNATTKCRGFFFLNFSIVLNSTADFSQDFNKTLY